MKLIISILKPISPFLISVKACVTVHNFYSFKKLLFAKFHINRVKVNEV